MIKKFIVLSSIFMVVTAMAAEEPVLPKDVQDYIDDRVGCNHLGAEDYSDPSRGRAMAAALRECGFGNLNGVPVNTYTVVTVDMVEKRLRKKYRQQPDILKAMDNAKNQLPSKLR